MSLDTLTLFADPLLRKVIETVVQRGKIQIGELKKQVDGDPAVDSAIQTLRDKHLIESTAGPVTTFQIVYPTSEGLDAVRRFRRAST